MPPSVPAVPPMAPSYPGLVAFVGLLCSCGARCGFVISDKDVLSPSLPDLVKSLPDRDKRALVAFRLEHEVLSHDVGKLLSGFSSPTQLRKSQG